MTPLIALGIGAAELVLKQYLAWQEQRARDAAWKPDENTINEFIADMARDTVEKIQDEVAAEQGKTWADRKPAKDSPPMPPGAPDATGGS